MALSTECDGMVQSALGRRLEFARGDVATGLLRNISNLLLDIYAERSPDWEVMCPIFDQVIDEEVTVFLIKPSMRLMVLQCFLKGYKGLITLCN